MQQEILDRLGEVSEEIKESLLQMQAHCWMDNTNEKIMEAVCNFARAWGCNPFDIRINSELRGNVLSFTFDPPNAQLVKDGNRGRFDFTTHGTHIEQTITPGDVEIKFNGDGKLWGQNEEPARREKWDKYAECHYCKSPVNHDEVDRCKSCDRKYCTTYCAEKEHKGLRHPLCLEPPEYIRNREKTDEH